MATTGPKAPTAAVTASEAPWSDNDWVNPANIYGAGEAIVIAATFDAKDQTYVLKASGFDFSAIPAGSTIDGVQVVINARYTVAIGEIDLCQLLDASLAKVGTNQYSTPQALTTTAADYTIGGATDKWGNALDAAWVKNANFGVAIGCLAGGFGNNNVDVFIDSVTMEVWYTAPAASDTPITPTVGSVSVVAVASLMGLGMAPLTGSLSATSEVARQNHGVKVPSMVRI